MDKTPSRANKEIALIMFIQVVFFLLSLCGLIAFKDTGTPSQRSSARKRYVVFLMFLLILQSGLRNVAVGNDTYAYYNMFTRVMNTPWDQIFQDVFQQDTKDPGYIFLTKLFSSIIPNYRIFLIAIAIFFFSSLGVFLYKNLASNLEVCVSVALYECLYYSFFSITGHRQTIATALLLIALTSLLNKGYSIKNILLILALQITAASIHKSAYLFVPVFFLPLIHNSFIIFAASFVLFIPMFSAGSIIGSYLEDSDFEFYAHYMEQSDTSGAFVFSLYIFVLVCAVFIKLKTINSFSHNNYVFSNAIAIALLLTPLLVLNPSNQRIVQYYSIFGLVMLPQVCRAYSGSSGRKILFYLVFIVFALYTVMRHDSYAFFWQDMPLFDSGQIINDSIIE